MQFSRREFIGAGALAAAGCCAPRAGKTYVSEPVEILRKATLRKPGEKLRMGFIGSGGVVARTWASSTSWGRRSSRSATWTSTT